MILHSFLSSFPDSKFEFVISNQEKWLLKVLSFEGNFSYEEKLLRKQRISAFVQTFFPQYSPFIESLFSSFPHSDYQIWIDLHQERLKIYIGVWGRSLEDIQMITLWLSSLLWRQISYTPRENRVSFDCIGIDLSWEKSDVKFYEVCQDDLFSQLPSYISHKEVKYSGYLTSLSGREKKYFRFDEPFPLLERFSQDFDMSSISSFFHAGIITWNVKYFCVEWDKKELYFI